MTLTDDLTCVETKLQKGFKKRIQDKCLKCRKKAVVLLAYGPQYYCKNHFIELTEKRVKKFIRQNNLVNAGEKIIIALSGGKDSTMLLHLMCRFFKKSNELHALIINEGIPGYRDESIETAVKNCDGLGMNYSIVGFKDFFGTTTTEISRHISHNPKLGTNCSFCGIMRRRIMNSFALEKKADKLATGHNLDDEDQSILMNVFDNNIQRFFRLGPSTGIRKMKGLVPRIKPIAILPEQEVIAYCHLSGIKFHEGECCPYSKKAKRNQFRSMLNEFEEKYPGTKHSIISFFLELKKYLNLEKEKNKSSVQCKECGELSSGETCNVCVKLGVVGN